VTLKFVNPGLPTGLIKISMFSPLVIIFLVLLGWLLLFIGGRKAKTEAKEAEKKLLEREGQESNDPEQVDEAPTGCCGGKKKKEDNTDKTLKSDAQEKDKKNEKNKPKSETANKENPKNKKSDPKSEDKDKKNKKSDTESEDKDKKKKKNKSDTESEEDKDKKSCFACTSVVYRRIGKGCMLFAFLIFIIVAVAGLAVKFLSWGSIFSGSFVFAAPSRIALNIFDLVYVFISVIVIVPNMARV
jgi:hypothetical protein